MDLKDKLRRFAAEQPKQNRPSRASNLDAILHGREITNAFGSYYLVERVFPADYFHGCLTLGHALTADIHGLALIANDSALTNINFERTLFFDTETTGLAGGAGTCAFLIGVGFFQGEQFIVRQYLMRDYHEEQAMLYDLHKFLSQYDAVVSFNGKCFDWPLLRDRFVLARFTPLNRTFLHLDLLYPARRLWRSELPDCSLHSIETHILKVSRGADLPGNEVPQRYFDFVRTKQGDLLVVILDHNRNDILSLVILTSVIGLLMQQPARNLNSASTCCALAKVYVQNKTWEKAISYYQRAAELAEHDGETIDLSQMARIYRRLAQWENAVPIWQYLAENCADIQAYEELAKYYEHICKDYQLAKQTAQRGLALALTKDRTRVSAFEYRLERLERKLTKAKQLELLTS